MTIGQFAIKPLTGIVTGDIILKMAALRREAASLAGIRSIYG